MFIYKGHAVIRGVPTMKDMSQFEEFVCRLEEDSDRTGLLSCFRVVRVLSLRFRGHPTWRVREDVASSSIYVS